MVSLEYGEMPTSITAEGDVLDNGKSSIREMPTSITAIGDVLDNGKSSIW
jgi:hypothetical protein